VVVGAQEFGLSGPPCHVARCVGLGPLAGLVVGGESGDEGSVAAVGAFDGWDFLVWLAGGTVPLLAEGVAVEMKPLGGLALALLPARLDFDRLVAASGTAAGTHCLPLAFQPIAQFALLGR